MYIYMELKINDKYEVLFNVFGKFLYKYWNLRVFFKVVMESIEF